MTAVEETSANSLEQDVADSTDRQASSNNDTWQSNVTDDEKSDINPDVPENTSTNAEPPLKVPKIATSNSSEIVWENSPSSQSSVEWHIPSSNASSASEAPGECEAPEASSTATNNNNNNVQSNSESSNLSVSRTSFNDEKESQLPKAAKTESNDESIVETNSTSDVSNTSKKEGQTVGKTDETSDVKIDTEIPKEDSKNINSSEPAPTDKLPEDSVESAAEFATSENSPLSDEFWKKQNPLVDHVLITDVTKNHLTVTVRECDTSSGFFKDRPNGTKSAENMPAEKEESSL